MLGLMQFYHATAVIWGKMNEGISNKVEKEELLFLPKLNKPPGDPTSYHLICLMDTMGKIIMEVVYDSLQHMVGKKTMACRRARVVLAKSIF